MPPLNRKLPLRKRNASSKPKARDKAKHFRNATAAPPRAAPPPRPRPNGPAARERGVVSEVLRLPELGGVLQTLGGAALASGLGAAAVRSGIHPYLASTVLGGLGAIVAWQADRPMFREISLGMASAAGSQLVLLALNPRITAPDQVAANQSKPSQLPPPARPITLPQPKPRAADLSGLPPGMLDAALERARADLAVASDGYPPGYEPYPEGHLHNHDHTHLTQQ
jgi:hypothetical protein